MVLRHQPRLARRLPPRLRAQPDLRAAPRQHDAAAGAAGRAAPRAPPRRPGSERRRRRPPRPGRRGQADRHRDRRRHDPDAVPRARRRGAGGAATAPLPAAAAAAGPRGHVHRRSRATQELLRGPVRRRQLQRLPAALRHDRADRAATGPVPALGAPARAPDPPAVRTLQRARVGRLALRLLRRLLALAGTEPLGAPGAARRRVPRRPDAGARRRPRLAHLARGCAGRRPTRSRTRRSSRWPT